jgi:hypothetical protein
LTEGGGGYKEPPEMLFGISVEGWVWTKKRKDSMGLSICREGGRAWHPGKGKALSTMSSFGAPSPALSQVAVPVSVLAPAPVAAFNGPGPGPSPSGGPGPGLGPCRYQGPVQVLAPFPVLVTIPAKAKDYGLPMNTYGIYTYVHIFVYWDSDNRPNGTICL